MGSKRLPLSRINLLRRRMFRMSPRILEFAMRSAPVPIAIFDFLDKTHRDIQQQIQSLHALVDSIASDGLSEASRATARKVLDYFNHEARQHHLDEEEHIFPALLASQDAEVVQAAQHLTQDHGWLEENWLQIEPSIEAATNGNLWFDLDELRHALEVFEALYADHILLEESLAYPEAKKRLAGLDTAGMGREMARRRVLKSQHMDLKPI
jgi:hemerythrin-like domain-containing protein